MSKINGAKITELRKQRGWDQYELAEAAQIAPSVISRLERNLQADFKLSVLDAVASALNVSIDSLLVSDDTTMGEWAVELQVMVDQLRKRPLTIQRHVAGMIRGYLAALDDERN